GGVHPMDEVTDESGEAHLAPRHVGAGSHGLAGVDRPAAGRGLGAGRPTEAQRTYCGPADSTQFRSSHMSSPASARPSTVPGPEGPSAPEDAVLASASPVGRRHDRKPLRGTGTEKNMCPTWAAGSVRANHSYPYSCGQNL